MFYEYHCLLIILLWFISVDFRIQKTIHRPEKTQTSFIKIAKINMNTTKLDKANSFIRNISEHAAFRGYLHDFSSVSVISCKTKWMWPSKPFNRMFSSVENQLIRGAIQIWRVIDLLYIKYWKFFRFE